MDSTTQPPNREIRRLVGVYDADSTVRSEVAYWIGARLGRRHCSLCDITHGPVRRRPEWTGCRAGLPVPFDTWHRDVQPDTIRRATGDVAPVVVAETTGGSAVLLNPSDLEACSRSIDRLLEMIDSAADRLDIAWQRQS